MTNVEFCSKVNNDVGPVHICFTVGDGISEPGESSHTRRLDGHQLRATSSIPLVEALRSYDWPPKQRLVLAYLLAYATWRFYGTDWMQPEWSLSTIHFMPHVKSKVNGISARDPCLEFKFEGRAESIPEEITDTEYAHRFPHILSLGVLLVKVTSSKSISDWSFSCTADDMPKAFNTFIHDYYSHVKNDQSWPELDLNENIRKPYRTIVKRCFDDSEFTTGSRLTHGKRPSSDTLLNSDLEVRKHKLYKAVVKPLHQLLISLNWHGAIDSQQPDLMSPELDFEKPIFGATFASQIGVESVARGLGLSEVNGHSALGSRSNANGVPHRGQPQRLDFSLLGDDA